MEVKKLQLLALGLVLLIGGTSCQLHLFPPTTPSESITETSNVVTSATPTDTAQATSVATATSTIRATLMATATSTPYIPSFPVFGVGMDHLNSSWGLDQMVSAGIRWIRPEGMKWSSIEPAPGAYDWSQLAGLETELENASSKGLQVILLVHSTPGWARKDGGAGPWCGPIASDKLAYFGDFMHELVSRLDVAPYNVKYWELWNEEDVSANVFTGDNGYGCWGDPSDTYFGGGYYAEMLKAAYPKIKQANPQAQVLIGGLLLDCDPRGSQSPCATVHPNDPNAALPGMFLEGILQNNGGAYFDGISFHSYDHYNLTAAGQGYYFNPNWQSASNTTGPSSIVKVQFIQSMLTKYGVTGKYLMNTESALICGKTGTEAACQTDMFTNVKDAYLAEAYAAAMAQGLRANLWYSALGWRGSGLLGSQLTPLPAYYALQFSSNELGSANWVRDINDYTGVMGYEFNRGDRRIWILWSLDGSAHTITLTGTPLAVKDVLGNPVTPADSVNITQNPLYFEWNP